MKNLGFIGTLSIAVIWFTATSATAQVLQELPQVAEGIGVDQNLGAELPLHLEFDDDENNRIRLGELFRGDRPVLLSFNYSNCPQLCVVQLNNLAAALQQIDLIPGKDFDIVSVSLDPTEASRQLRETKRKYVVAYGDTKTSDGWHFLRSDKQTIKQLADVCGFRYKYIPEQRFYSHPAAFIFCTSDGRIARYLDGLDGQLESSLKPALMEAGRGEIGSLVDKVIYFAGCYWFDPTTGQYSLAAISVMRLAGAVTVVVLLVTLTPYWFRRTQVRRQATQAGAGRPFNPTTNVTVSE